MRKFLLDISDKIIIKEEKYFPPHRIPHSLPFIGELVTNERCHYHLNHFRMFHHKPFCKMLACPNYEAMIKAYNNR